MRFAAPGTEEVYDSRIEEAAAPDDDEWSERAETPEIHRVSVPTSQWILQREQDSFAPVDLSSIASTIENLMKRFPAVGEAAVRHAVEQAKGHGGLAVRILTSKYVEVRARTVDGAQCTVVVDRSWNAADVKGAIERDLGMKHNELRFFKGTDEITSWDAVDRLCDSEVGSLDVLDLGVVAEVRQRDTPRYSLDLGLDDDEESPRDTSCSNSSRSTLSFELFDSGLIDALEMSIAEAQPDLDQAAMAW